MSIWNLLPVDTLTIAGTKYGSSTSVSFRDVSNNPIVCAGTFYVDGKDAYSNITHCHGTITAASMNTATKFQKGCIYVKTNVTTGSSGVYQNNGTTTSASFVLIGSAASTYEIVMPISIGDIGAIGSTLLYPITLSTDSKTITRINAFCSANTGTATIDVKNNATSLLTSPITLVANSSVAGVLTTPCTVNAGPLNIYVVSQTSVTKLIVTVQMTGTAT